MRRYTAVTVYLIVVENGVEAEPTSVEEILVSQRIVISRPAVVVA